MTRPTPEKGAPRMEHFQVFERACFMSFMFISPTQSIKRH